MAENVEKLRTTLHELEKELSSISTLDEETRSRLELLKDEISQVLATKGPREAERHDSLASRLQEAAEGFESSHPTLFGIVSRTIDALGQIGI